MATGGVAVGAGGEPETAPYADYYLRPFETAARSLGVEPVEARVRSATDIEQFVTSFATSDAALIVMPFGSCPYDIRPPASAIKRNG